MDNTIILVITFLVIILGIILFVISYFLRRKLWNNGKCSKCGKKWVYFDTDSQGGKGYTDGKHYIWI